MTNCSQRLWRCSSHRSDLFPCQLKSEPESPSSVGVMDGSRLLLCALTFFCLSLNPLPSLLGSETTSGSPNFSPGHGPSRTLVWFPNHTQDFGKPLPHFWPHLNYQSEIWTHLINLMSFL